MNLTSHREINLYVKGGKGKTNYTWQNFNVTSTRFHIFQQTFYGTCKTPVIIYAAQNILCHFQN